MRKVLFLIAALAAVSIQGSQDSVPIHWKPKAGDAAELSVQVKADMQGMAIEVLLRQKTKILEVSADGIKMENSEEMVDLKFNGQSMMDAIPPGGSRKVYTLRADGELLSYSVDGGEDNPRLEDAMVFLYPNREVKVGEAWTRTRPGNKDKGVPASKTTFTFLGTESLDGAQALKIRIAFTETEGSTPMTFDATAWLAPANGDLLKLEGVIKNATFDPNMPPMDATVKMMRVK
jgi:hypothetical protein